MKYMHIKRNKIKSKELIINDKDLAISCRNEMYKKKNDIKYKNEIHLKLKYERKLKMNEA